MPDDRVYPDSILNELQAIVNACRAVGGELEWVGKMALNLRSNWGVAV